MPRLGNVIRNAPLRYFRPRIMDQGADHAAELKAKGKRIGQNMWKIDTYSMGRKGGYQTLILFTPDYKKWETIAFPTDKKGQIPLDIGVYRLMDIADGDRQGAARNVMIDLVEDAATKYKPDELAGTYRWYIWPNESDIFEVDDANSKLVEVLEKEKGHKGPRHIIIMGGTDEQRADLAAAIKEGFTAYEKKILAGTIIEIGDLRHKAAGMFYQHDKRGDIPAMGHIVIDKRYTDQWSTMVHEAIHALRQFDPQRFGALKAPPVYVGKAADFEEGTTEGESVIRTKPFGKYGSNRGYYYFVEKQTGKAADALLNEDRVTGTKPDLKKQGPFDKSLRGKRAQKAILERFPEMNIAKLKHKGNVEAVETFFAIKEAAKGQTPKQDELKVQVLNPVPNPSDTKAEKFVESLAPAGAKVVQYHREGEEVLTKAGIGKQPLSFVRPRAARMAYKGEHREKKRLLIRS